MLQRYVPPRQLAHNLIERLNNEHLAIVNCMLQTMADAEQAAPTPAAFSDEGIPERERGRTAEEVSGARQGVERQVSAEQGGKSDDTDYWPERRDAPLRHSA